MRIDDVLKLAGVDIVAGGDYHTLCTAAEVYKALIVHRAEVARIYPSQTVIVLAQGLRRLLGVTDIFHHDRGACDEYLALGAVGYFLVGAGLDYLVISVGEGQTDAAFLGHVRRGEAGCRDALGRAEALTDLYLGIVVVQEFVKLLFKLYRQTVAAGEHALERAEVGIFHRRQAQQRFVKRGNAGDEVTLILNYLLCVGLGGEPRDEDAAAALREHRVYADTQTEAMEQRHCGEHLVADAEHGVCGDDLLAESVKVLIGKQDALRRTCRAAGVEDDCGVIALALDLVVIEAVARQVQKVLPADDGSVIGDLFDLAAFGEHVACLDGL